MSYFVSEMGCGSCCPRESVARQSEDVLFASGDGDVSSLLLIVKSPKGSGQAGPSETSNKVHHFTSRNSQVQAFYLRSISTPSRKQARPQLTKTPQTRLPTRPRPGPSFRLRLRHRNHPIQQSSPVAQSRTHLVSQPKPPVKNTRATKPKPQQEKNMQALFPARIHP